MWVSCDSTYLASKALTASCSRRSFQGCSYSEQTWKKGIVCPSGARGKLAKSLRRQNNVSFRNQEEHAHLLLILKDEASPGSRIQSCVTTHCVRRCLGTSWYSVETGAWEPRRKRRYSGCCHCCHGNRPSWRDPEQPLF